MNINIQQIMRESLYGSPTLPQSDQSTFSPCPFRDKVSISNGDNNFEIGTAEFGYQFNDTELNNVMKQVEPMLKTIGVEYWSANKTDKVINISITKNNIDKAKDILSRYGFHYSNKTFGGEARTPDMNSTPKLTAYGREAGQNSAFGGGGMLNGYPIDRLAGE
jgi:hypothetical protein